MNPNEFLYRAFDRVAREVTANHQSARGREFVALLDRESAYSELYEALEWAQKAIVSLTRALPQGDAPGNYCAVLDEAEEADLAVTAALAHARGEK